MTATTDISFFVSVPVLSEQITSMLPRVSTAGIFFMMAFCLAIRVTPTDKIIERTAGNPSGIAETAKAIIADSSSSPVISL